MHGSSGGFASYRRDQLAEAHREGRGACYNFLYCIKSYTTYGGHANAPYVYASTTQDHKWFWESVRYSFQTWSSVRLVYLGPWYWYNAYCVVGWNG
jgi:hypothetical protein